MRSRKRSAVVLMATILGAVASASAQAQAPPSSPPSGSGQLRQVAYLKASNPAEDANFGSGGTLTGNAGNSAAISGDGNTLAVGAPHESSGAKGINGNQNDNSALHLRRGVRLQAHGQRPGRSRPTSRHPTPAGRQFRIHVRLEQRRQHPGRRCLLRSQRRHRHQRQPERSTPSRRPAPSTSSPAPAAPGAAGLHQGVEHREGR